MFQVIQGVNVYVVDLLELPALPIHDGGDPALRPYAEALDTAIRTGIVTKPGKYAVDVNLATNHWNVYLINE